MTTLAQALVRELADAPEALEELRQLLAPPVERLLTSKQAADFLNVHVETLNRARRAGRVVGAERVGASKWGYRLSELKMLPPPELSIAPTAGRGVRRPGTSGATAAIRGKAA